MAKRYRRVRRYFARTKRRASKMTIPVALVGGVGAGMVTPIMKALEGDYKSSLEYVVYNYTGMRQSSPGVWIFDMTGLKSGVLPMIAGAIVHKAAGKFGINAALGKAGVPIFRV